MDAYKHISTYCLHDECYVVVGDQNFVHYKVPSDVMHAVDQLLASQLSEDHILYEVSMKAQDCRPGPGFNSINQLYREAANAVALLRLLAAQGIIADSQIDRLLV